MAGQALAHLRLGRLRIALEQVGRRNDHAVGAVAALRGLLVDEGLLQWMQLVEGAEPLQRGDLVLAELRDRHHAGAHGRAVDEHRAGPALRQAAAELGAVKLEIIAQHVEQRGVRLGVDRAGRPVDLQADGHARLLSPLNRSILMGEFRPVESLLRGLYRGGRSPWAQRALASAAKSAKRRSAMAIRRPAISSW